MDPDRWQSGSGAADLFSEGEVEGLVLPVVKVDGRGAAQDASCFQRPLRGGTPRRQTGHPDPSPDEEWMEPGVNGIAGNKHIHPSLRWRSRHGATGAPGTDLARRRAQ